MKHEIGKPDAQGWYLIMSQMKMVNDCKTIPKDVISK